MVGGVGRGINIAQLCEECRGVMAARPDRATTSKAFEGLRGFNQMVVFEFGLLGHAMLPHVIGNLVPGLGCGHHGLGIQFTDAPGGKDGGVQAVSSEEFEEAPDAHASAKLAFGELHGQLIAGTSQQHGVEVHRQAHGHTYARWVGKVLKMHMPCAVALGSSTEFLEFALHRTGHPDLTFCLWSLTPTSLPDSLSALPPGTLSPAASAPAR